MRGNEDIEHARPRVQVQTRQEREISAASWLLCAADDRAAARKDWDAQGLTLLRCGSLFAAIRLPGDIVRAAAGSEHHADIDAYLAAALPSGGAVIADGYSARYYALVPASTGRWWHVPGTTCLGSGAYLGVPVPSAERTAGVRSYWAVPMDGPGVLCSPTEVQQVMRHGRERAGADERASAEAVALAVPLDIQTMRSAAERACGDSAPAGDELDECIEMLRAYAEVLVPEVKHLAGQMPADNRAASVALIGAEEGQRRLGSGEGGEPHRVARRTAMSVLSLCRHYENLVRPSVS